MHSLSGLFKESQNQMMYNVMCTTHGRPQAGHYEQLVEVTRVLSRYKHDRCACTPIRKNFTNHVYAHMHLLYMNYRLR